MSRLKGSEHRTGGACRSRTRGISLCCFAASTVAAGLTAVPAVAATADWVGPANTPSPWETPANWSITAVPDSDDDALINDSGIATVTTYSDTVNTLSVGSVSGETGTLIMSAGSIHAANDHLHIGRDGGTGNVTLEGTAALTASNDVLLGRNGGVAHLTIKDSANISSFHFRPGFSDVAAGSATIIQTGGTVTPVAWVEMGNGGTVNYTISGGSISSGAGEFAIGHQKPATVNLSGTGSITAANNSLKIGYGAWVNTQGILNMTGGTTHSNNFIFVGDFGVADRSSNGLLNLDDGAVTARYLSVGQNANAIGVIDQSGGSITLSPGAGGDAVGVISESGRGTYNLSGGVFDLGTGGNYSLRVGARVGGTGVDGQFNGGTFNVSGTGEANVGRHILVGGTALPTGEGKMNVSGGTVNVGVAPAPTLEGILGIGAWGKGYLTITGGTVNTEVFWSGYNASTAATVTEGQGQITHSAGTLNVSNDMKVGQSTDKDNFYEITGGTINVTDELSVAEFSTDVDNFTAPAPPPPAMFSNGRLTIDGTATVNVAGRLSNSLGYEQTAGPNIGKIMSGGTGIIEMKGGTLTAGSFVNGRAPDPTVPNNGSATYVQTGGTASLGHVTGTGSISVSGGTMLVSSLRQATSTISGNGLVRVLPDGTAAGTSVVNALSIADSGKLDLTDNKLITSSPVGTFSSGAYTGVTGLVDSARGNLGVPLWDGPGLTTSDSRAQGSNLVSIGVAKAGDVKGIADTDTATFAGQTVLGSDTIAMVTYGGDATLDGKINIDDYGRIDANVAQSGTVFGWYNGDFNYDGAINIDDYGIIDGNIGNQGDAFVTSGSVAASQGVSAVPEPTGLGLAALCAASLLGRCRRSPRHMIS